jgi:hypothetical protein
LAPAGHLDLLHVFLAHRDEIVERIQGVLNAQRKSAEYRRDVALLTRHFEDCFFTPGGVTDAQAQLRGQLEAAHWASGFRPKRIPGLHNGLADPAEMMVRAFHVWDQSRWPGRNGRLRYAHTLFNLYLIRCLELLSLRLWDLARLQAALDELWKGTPADQPVLLRDARWLIQMAQSPATDDLGVYFEVAETIADTLRLEDRIAICKAGVCLTGGHLRAQIRYHSLRKGVAFDDASVVLDTRNTNALDFALLVQELVPLLDAYERASHAGDDRTRRALADGICQGVSPDPELFLNQIGLLGAYSMIEHLFVSTDGGGHADYTPMGRRHVRLLQEYADRIGRVAELLLEDCAHFRPAAGAYSPYGVMYGFASNLIEHMALKTAMPEAVERFGVEDVFVAGDARTLAWVNSWRALPHLTREQESQFEYPQQFAEDVFARIEASLGKRVSGEPVRTGRFFVVAEDDPRARGAHRPESYDEKQLLSDRREGRCIISYQTPAGWVALRKTLLTEALGAGHDATIAGVPPAAVDVLKLVCPGLGL